MFITSEFTKVENPLHDVTEYGWSRVELMLNAPWYFCSFIDTRFEGLNRSLLLDHIHQLIDMFLDKNIKVREAYIVTPGYVNKSDTWQMERIIQIKQSLNHDLNNSNTVYKVIKSDGSEMVIDGVLLVDSNSLSFEEFVSL